MVLAVAGAAVAGGPAARAAAAARPAPVQAFVLTSAPDSLVDLRAHAGAIGVVYPTYFDCSTTSGQITGGDSPVVSSYARSRRMTLMPRVNCQDGATVHRILTTPALRGATLAHLVAISRTPGYRGLCIDFENDGSADRAALSSFVSDLARTLHRRGLRLTVVVDGVTRDNPGASTGFYDYGSLSASADTVFVLAWGTHWAGSGPGPISSLAYVEGVLRYVSSLPDASRFVIGAPMYGIDWQVGGQGPTAGSALQYSGVLSLLRSAGARPSRDPESKELTFPYIDAAGEEHRVWFMDAHAVLAILGLARKHGLAVGLWRLGREDQTLWPAI